MEAALAERESLGESEVAPVDHVESVLLRFRSHLVHIVELHLVVLWREKERRERGTSASICSK